MVVSYPSAGRGTWTSFFTDVPVLLLQKRGSVIPHVMPQIILYVGLSIMALHWNPLTKISTVRDFMWRLYWFWSTLTTESFESLNWFSTCTAAKYGKTLKKLCTTLKICAFFWMILRVQRKTYQRQWIFWVYSALSWLLSRLNRPRRNSGRNPCYSKPEQHHATLVLTSCWP